MESVMANPNCSKEAAKDAMEAVWDICYNDTQPFDRAPWGALKAIFKRANTQRIIDWANDFLLELKLAVIFW